MPNFCPNGSPRALLISPDPRITTELKDLLASELPLAPVAIVDCYPDRTTLAELASLPGDRLWFLDTISDREVAFRLMSAIAVCAPAVAIVALLRNDDPDMILQCLRQGASEFLIYPFTADQLKHALDRLTRLQTAGAPHPPAAATRARVYCVIPGKGACGATTLASSLAYAMKRLDSRKVLLADLDGLTGTVPFLLKLKSNYSFIDALAHASSLDADLWKVLVIPCHGIDVLLSPENPVDSIGQSYDPAPILSYSRGAYETVILDTAGAYGDWNLALAGLSDELLIVTTNELPALHATERALLHLENNGTSRSKVRLVVNRYYPDLGLRKEGIEAALRASVFHTIPSDYKAIQKALLEGKAFPPRSRFGKSVAALAQQLTAPHPPAVNGSLWSGLRKRFA